MIATKGSGCWPGSGLLQDAASVKAVSQACPEVVPSFLSRRAEDWAGHPTRERSNLQRGGSGVAAGSPRLRRPGRGEEEEERRPRAHPGRPLPGRPQERPCGRGPIPGYWKWTRNCKMAPDARARQGHQARSWPASQDPPGASPAGPPPPVAGPPCGPELPPGARSPFRTPRGTAAVGAAEAGPPLRATAGATGEPRARAATRTPSWDACARAALPTGATS